LYIPKINKIHSPYLVSSTRVYAKAFSNRSAFISISDNTKG
jgi:hypothetical protein